MENRVLEFRKESVDALLSAYYLSLQNLQSRGQPCAAMQGRIRALEALRNEKADNFVNELLSSSGQEVQEAAYTALTVNKAFYFRRKLCETMKTQSGEQRSFIKGAAYVFEILLMDKIDETAERKMKKVSTARL